MMKGTFLAIFYIVASIVCIGLVIMAFGEGIVQSIGGNKQIFDTNAKFNKAYINMGDETIQVDIKKWKDYDGEQLQITTTDGKVYLVSSYNAVLVNDKED